jgi:hypothetical protein
MSANEYHFVTQWRVAGTVEQVSDVLGEPADLELHTKGWLPYTLRWFFRVTESRRPFGFSLEAWGDFC